MTGNEIMELRESLQLTRRGFAKLVNVAPSVLKRWEFHGDKHVLLSGHSKRILGVLMERVNSIGAMSAVASLSDESSDSLLLKAIESEEYDESDESALSFGFFDESQINRGDLSESSLRRRDDDDDDDDFDDDDYS